MPDVIVRERDTAPPRVMPTDTSRSFVVGTTVKGPLTPTKITSLEKLITVYGDRAVPGTLIYDWFDAAFNEGLSESYFQRVVGDAAAAAKHDFSDSTPATTIRFEAESVGAWGNELNVEIAAGTGSTRVIIVTNDDGDELDRSGDLATKTDILEWADGSLYVNAVSLAGTGMPVVVTAQSLTGGTDDHGSLTDQDWIDAVNAFDADLGPGQIVAPGVTDEEVQTAILLHAYSRNRWAVLDGADTGTSGTLRAGALAFATYAHNRNGEMFGPWAKIPGLLPRTTREVPYSAIVCGQISRIDKSDGPGEAPAGERYGDSAAAIGLNAEFTKDELNALSDAGFNLAVMKFGGVRTYGARSLAPKDTDPKHWWAPGQRVMMAVHAKCEVVLERHLFRQIDGKRVQLGKVYGDLVAEACRPYYRQGALFGNTEDEAFKVDVDTPNDLASLQDGWLKAIIQLKTSPGAEFTQVEIVKRLITETI